MAVSRFKIWKDKQKDKWGVSIPPELSGSGKRERRFFTKKTEAEAFAKAGTTRLLNDGTAAMELSRMERDIASKAFLLLRKGLPSCDPSVLLQAVDEFLTARDRRSRSKLFKDAFEEWQTWTLNRTRNGKPTSRKYALQIRQALPRFEELHSMLLCDITPDDVEGALASAVLPEHKHAKNGLLRVLNACFKYAKERQWLDEVPIRAKLSKADTGQNEPSVLTPDQVTRLLCTCIEQDRELLPYYVLALFAAIRPTDEMRKLQWHHVFADGGKHIHIPAEVAKTGRQRYIVIEPILSQWLIYIQPPQMGPVTPTRKLEKRRRKIQRAAGIDPWPQNALRHSYASYWMTVYRDEDRCRDNMGHRTKEQLVNHYRRHTTEVQAAEFWSLSPDKLIKVNSLRKA